MMGLGKGRISQMGMGNIIRFDNAVGSRLTLCTRWFVDKIGEGPMLQMHFRVKANA
jgi:hypothetical protein